MNKKNSLFSFIELIINAIKVHGLIFGLRFTYYMVKVRFFLPPSAQKTHIFGKVLVFRERESALLAVSEMFGAQMYYFKTNEAHPVIVDVGANVGDSAIYFKWLYPDAIIYAYEPNRAAHDLLQENIRANKFENVNIFNEAIGPEEKEVTFYDDAKGAYNLGTTKKDFIEETARERSSGISESHVTQKRLSQKPEIVNLNKISLLKVDIEGAEAGVFSDLQGLYSKIEQIIFEYHILPDITNNSFDSIVSNLQKAGFQLNVVGGYKNDQNLTNPHTFIVNAYKPHAPKD